VVLAHVLSVSLRQQVRDAVAVGYVPSPELRERYPAQPAAATEDYSSLALAEDAIVPAPRRITTVPTPLRLVTVCSIDFPYKGVDVLVQAVGILRRSGVDATATVVGEGRLREQYRQDSIARGLGDVITFTGQVGSGRAIRDNLDKADVFVLASLTEGLPRAMVEAMARGLPCVGTSAGGIPALLPPQYCARPGDAVDLARAIMASTRTVDAMSDASTVNLRRADCFRATETHRRSDRVYRALLAATAESEVISRTR
jgi:glycosyltransferase involved in cell wall biosynthesis